MLRGVPTRTGRRRAGWLGPCAPSALPGGLGVSGDALDGILEVRSAYVNIDKGVFLLHARVEYPGESGHPRRAARWHHADLRSRCARRARPAFLVQRRHRRPDAAARAELPRRQRPLRGEGHQERRPDHLSQPSTRRSTTSGTWTPGRSWSSRSWTAATTPSACAPVCVAATCPRRCARSCSGRMTGRA